MSKYTARHLFMTTWYKSMIQCL